MRWIGMMLLSAFLAFGCGDSDDDGDAGTGGVGAGGTGGSTGDGGGGGGDGGGNGDGGDGGGDGGDGGGNGDGGDGGNDQQPFTCVEGADGSLFAMVEPGEGRLTWNEDLAPGQRWEGRIGGSDNNSVTLIIQVEDPEDGVTEEDQVIQWPDGELGRIFAEGTDVEARWSGQWFEVTDGTYTAALHYGFTMDGSVPSVDAYGPFTFSYEESCDYQVGSCDASAYFNLIVDMDGEVEELEPTHYRTIGDWVVTNRGAALRVGSLAEEPACDLSFFGSAITISTVRHSPDE